MLSDPPTLPAPSVRPAIRLRAWTPFVVFTVALTWGVVVSSATLAALCVARHGVDSLSSLEQLAEVTQSPLGLALSSLAVELGLLSVVICAAMFSAQPMRQRLGLSAPRMGLLAWPLAMIGALAAGQMVESTAIVAGFEMGPALESLSHVITTSGLPAFLLILTIFTLAPGIIEELLCRGYIQTRLLRLWGPAAAIGMSSALFGIMHLDVMHSTLAFFMGLFLGYVAYRSGSIIPAIVCHAFNNAAAVLMTRHLPEIAVATHGILVACSAVIMILAVWAVTRWTDPTAARRALPWSQPVETAPASQPWPPMSRRADADADFGNNADVHPTARPVRSDAREAHNNAHRTPD